MNGDKKIILSDKLDICEIEKIVIGVYAQSQFPGKPGCPGGVSSHHSIYLKNGDKVDCEELYDLPSYFSSVRVWCSFSGRTEMDISGHELLKIFEEPIKSKIKNKRIHLYWDYGETRKMDRMDVDNLCSTYCFGEDAGT